VALYHCPGDFDFTNPEALTDALEVPGPCFLSTSHVLLELLVPFVLGEHAPVPLIPHLAPRSQSFSGTWAQTLLRLIQQARAAKLMSPPLEFSTKSKGHGTAGGSRPGSRPGSRSGPVEPTPGGRAGRRSSAHTASPVVFKSLTVAGEEAVAVQDCDGAGVGARSGAGVRAGEAEAEPEGEAVQVADVLDQLTQVWTSYCAGSGSLSATCSSLPKPCCELLRTLNPLVALSTDSRAAGVHSCRPCPPPSHTCRAAGVGSKLAA